MDAREVQEMLVSDEGIVERSESDKLWAKTLYPDIGQGARHVLGSITP